MFTGLCLWMNIDKNVYESLWSITHRTGRSMQKSTTCMVENTVPTVGTSAVTSVLKRGVWRKGQKALLSLQCCCLWCWGCEYISLQGIKLTFIVTRHTNQVDWYIRQPQRYPHEHILSMLSTRLHATTQALFSWENGIVRQKCRLFIANIAFFHTSFGESVAW